MLLGAFSYSLYLIHLPLIEKMNSLVRRHFPPLEGLAVMMIVGLPVSLLAAYLFHLAFERPFLSERRSRKGAAKKAASKLSTLAAPITAGEASVSAGMKDQ